jgi:septal ring factor EnvC (AmiA/AmiB activator)
MLLADTIAALQQDKQLVLEALDQARTEADACARQIAATKTEKEKMERDRDIVATQLKNLETSLGDMEAWIARLTALNQTMAGRIAKLQLEAAKRIDQRTRAMAQSGAGRL